MAVRVVTGPEWNRFATACRKAGSGGLMREVRAEIRGSAKPAVAAVKAAMPQFMPDRYAAELAPSLRVTVSAKAGGVSLRGHARTRLGRPRELRKLEAGRLRHRLYGRWIPGRFFQVVRPQFWSKPLRDHADSFRDGIRKAMDHVADQIAR